MSSIGEKLAASLRHKIEDHERSTRCGRSDLVLADYRKVGPHDYEILVEYSRPYGQPSISQLNEWTTSTFNGGLRLHMATVRHHPEISSMRGHLRENQIPVPMKRAANMIKMAGGKYMDQSKNQWEVQEAPNGEKILVRASDVKVEDLLEERLQRERSGRYARVQLDDIRTAGTADLAVGDTVLYAEPSGGQLQQTGTLSSVGSKEVGIKGREGSIPRSYVIDVVDKSPAEKEKRNKMLIDFMTENYFAGDKSIGKKMRIK